MSMSMYVCMSCVVCMYDAIRRQQCCCCMLLIRRVNGAVRLRAAGGHVRPVAKGDRQASRCKLPCGSRFCVCAAQRAWVLRKAGDDMQLDGQHQPPSPSSQPRHSALKRGRSFGSLQALDCSGDDDSNNPVEQESPSTDGGPDLRMSSRRASWSDEVGKELLTVHHGAPPASQTPRSSRTHLARASSDANQTTRESRATMPRGTGSGGLPHRCRNAHGALCRAHAAQW